MKRYEITDSRGWQHAPQECADGRWVRFDDVAQLERDYEATRAIDVRLQQQVEHLRAKNIAQVEALQAANVRLQGEVDRLRIALTDVLAHGCNECVECSVRINRLLAVPSTPGIAPQAPQPAIDGKCRLCEGFGFIDHGNGNSHTCRECEGSGRYPSGSRSP